MDVIVFKFGESCSPVDFDDLKRAIALFREHAEIASALIELGVGTEELRLVRDENSEVIFNVIDAFEPSGDGHEASYLTALVYRASVVANNVLHEPESQFFIRDDGSIANELIKAIAQVSIHYLAEVPVPSILLFAGAFDWFATKLRELRDDRKLH